MTGRALKTALSILLLAIVGCNESKNYNINDIPDVVGLAVPTEAQAVWQEDEIGMFVHFGIPVWRDGDFWDVPKIEYNNLFDPTDLDVNQWIDVAESFNAKYIIMVAKHTGGFCLWPTKSSPYNIANSPYKDGKGDLIKELSDACKKRGMKLGVYLSPADIMHGAAIGGGGVTTDPKLQEAYNKIYRQQLTELLSNYGEMMEVWFDGNLYIEVGDILNKYAPNAMILQGKYATIRWPGNERGQSRYPGWSTVDSSKAPKWAEVAAYTDIDGDPDGDL
jgi:alpha-L-fucosidase